MCKVESLIKHTGGDWYVAYREAFKDWKSAEFSLRVWNEAQLSQAD
jgi:hypothetical protein